MPLRMPCSKFKPPFFKPEKNICHIFLDQTSYSDDLNNVTSDHDVQEKSIIMRGSVILLVGALNLNLTALAILR